MMKRILTVLTALGMTFSLAACGGTEPAETTEPTLPLPLWAQEEQDRPTVPELTEAVETTLPEEETISQILEETTIPETSPEETAEEETVAETTEPPVDSSQYQMEEKFETIPAETVYVKKSVNIRPQANVHCTPIRRLQAGESMKRIGISKDGWSAVLYEEQVRYISSEYLTTEAQPEPTENPNVPSEREVDDMVYTVDDVNMREGPGFDRAVLCRVPEFIELHRTGIVSSGWSKVTYKDQVGYISTGYLSEKHPSETEPPEEEEVSDTVYTTREVNLRKGPGTSSAIIGRIPEGTELVRTAITSNKWGKVSYEGTVGYVSGEFLSVTAPAEG